jgi:hypothetical protein
MKEDNKNIIIGLLILAVGGLGYFYFKKNNKDKTETSGDGVLNNAVIPNSTTGSSTTGASTDTSKADKEKADKEKADNDKAIEKANKDRADKEILDKANVMAKRLLSLQATISSINADLNNNPWNPNGKISELRVYENEKSDLLYKLSNLGYMWSYPNEFATKR